MNSFKKRIGGILAAGLLTVTGAAMVAQPAYAAQKKVVTNGDKIKACMAVGGSFKACCAGAGGTYSVLYDKHGNLIGEHCEFSHIGSKPTAGTGIVTTPVSPVAPATSSPNAGTSVVTSPVAPVAPTPTPVTSPGTGIRTSPGGALAG